MTAFLTPTTRTRVTPVNAQVDKTGLGGYTMPAILTPTTRTRVTPFTAKVEEAGVGGYTVYNHMRLATFFRTQQEDYAHLKEAVQLWDVSVERQVEIAGPDALRLVQMMTPRDLSRMREDQCFYVPTVNAEGGMTNDPVLLRIGPDRFWLSIADSDLRLFAQGLVAALGLKVTISEPDINPLAIQGPKADQLVERLFGADIVATKFFRHQTVRIGETDMIIARSGWSCQGGFEIYFDGREDGEAFWDHVMDVGRDLDIHAGCPNGIERIEGGLLSYGNDMTQETTPFEAGLGKYCSETTEGCLAHDALQAARNPTRQIRAVEIECDELPTCERLWPVHSDGEVVGHISSASYSPDFKCGVSVGMIDASHWDGGTKVEVQTEEGPLPATIRDKFWI